MNHEDPNHLWPYFYEELLKRLKLKRAEPGASSSPASTHGAASFPLQGIEFSPFSEDSFTRRDILKLHLQQHVHVCLVACEELETYKKVVLSHVAKWLEVVHARRNQHTVLIQVTSSNATHDIVNSRSKPISRADLVLERLSTDFGGNKCNRIVQLRLKDMHDAGWSSTLDALSDAVYASFWAHMAGMEDDVRRLAGQKDLPGWNFCTFFITSEVLALSYSSIGFYERSLVVYDDLFKMFQEILMDNRPLSNDQSMQWALKPGKLSVDNLPSILFEPPTSSIREAIMQSSSNVYDFSMYLFGCRLRLWRELKKPVEMLKRATLFIIELANMTCDSDHREQSAAWTFDISLLILSVAEEISAKETKPSKDQTAYLFARGELCALARRQLDWTLSRFFAAFIDGRSVALQPNILQAAGSTKLHDFVVTKMSKWNEITDAVDIFLSCYVFLTKETIAGLIPKRLNRRISMSNCELAVIECLCGEYMEAETKLTTLIGPQRSENWPYLLCRLFELRAACRKCLGKQGDAIEDILEAWSVGIIMAENVDRILPELSVLIRESQNTLQVPMDPFFRFHPFKSQQDDSLRTDKLLAFVDWPYQYPLELDFVELVLAKDRCDIVFRAESSSLLSPGTFTPVGMTIGIGSVRFVKDFLTLPKKQSIEIRNEPSVLSISLEIPSKVLNTFDHKVTSGTLSLVPTDSELRLPTEVAWSGDAVEAQVTKVNNQLIALPKIPPQSCRKTALYLPDNARGRIEFNAQVQLKTSDQQDHHISQLVGIEILSPWKYHTKSCYLTGDQTLEQFAVSLSDGQAPLKLSESWFEFSDGLKGYFCRHDITFYRIVPRTITETVQHLALKTDLFPALTFYAPLLAKSSPTGIITATLSACISSLKVGTHLPASVEISLLRSETSILESWAVDVKYELDYSPDCWLLSGKVIGNVQLSRECPSIKQTFDLVPIRPGTLGLPTVQLNWSASSIPDIYVETKVISVPHICQVFPGKIDSRTIILSSGNDQGSIST
ncbi:hypothetical protein PSACC_01562 [Paramicrosporidium saccamoebae]|uniref:Uncharacterized protein n=1 Tax=Paramicrosporidium saccamoebae TaxID=1246581 RepID=A0A2H9TLH4_9FUNG|nr:hypothetical protein PSACC_01562 [Paramicrosporidium saccamoebae]